MSIGFGQLLIILLLILLLLGKFPHFLVEINKGIKSLKNIFEDEKKQNKNHNSPKIDSKSKKNSNL